MPSSWGPALLETSRKNIWAVGDAIGKKMFRHSATIRGIHIHPALPEVVQAAFLSLHKPL